MVVAVMTAEYAMGMPKKQKVRPREALNIAIDRALAARYTLKAIAIGAGVPYKSLIQYRRPEQHMGVQHREKLEKYCKNMGFFDPAPIGNEPALPIITMTSDPLQQAIGRLLLVLQEFSVSDMPKTDKAAQLKEEFRMIERRYLSRVKD